MLSKKEIVTWLDRTSAKGSRYKPLLSNGHDYLYPDCGGTVPYKSNQIECPFCSGHCTISLEDPRVKKVKLRMRERRK